MGLTYYKKVLFIIIIMQKIMKNKKVLFIIIIMQKIMKNNFYEK